MTSKTSWKKLRYQCCILSRIFYLVENKRIRKCWKVQQASLESISWIEKALQNRTKQRWFEANLQKKNCKPQNNERKTLPTNNRFCIWLLKVQFFRQLILLTLNSLAWMPCFSAIIVLNKMTGITLFDVESWQKVLKNLIAWMLGKNWINWKCD